MSKDLPYNEFEGQPDLPLPDEDQAWQKMNQLLDQDERRKPLLPAGLLKTCAGWGLLAALLLTGWFYLEPAKWMRGNNGSAMDPGYTTVQQTTKGEKNGQKIQSPEDRGEMQPVKPAGRVPVIRKDPEANMEKDTDGKVYAGQAGSTPIQSAEKAGIVKEDLSKKTEGTIEKMAGKNSVVNKSGKRVKDKGRGLIGGDEPNDEPRLPVDPAEREGNTDEGTLSALIEGKQPVRIPVLYEFPVGFIKAARDSFHGKPVIISPVAVPRVSRKKQYYLTAGLGLQQQIPLKPASDSIDDYERKVSIGDYIPSVYVRLNKGGKWFLQGELRYGAPQSLKEFSYSRETWMDSSVLRITTMRLRKTYYHQLPLSFNYYILPNWSVGAGGIYSRFYRAVTEQEIWSKDMQTQAEMRTKKLVEIPRFTDSFFYKTQVHLLFQSEFEWKRFSAGLRYTRDIQPYIRYTQPNGNVQEEKNQTLQVFLRFRLWKSKPFALIR